jgi:CRP-like cAMP-binding protein
MPMRDILSRFDGVAPAAFAAGESLIVEGRETGKLFVLKSGTVEIRRRGVVVTEISEPGAVLGELSLLLERPHTASVVAVTPVEAFGLADGLKSLAAQPELALHVAMLLAQRLESTTALLGRLKAAPAGTPQRRSLVERVLQLLTGQARGAGTKQGGAPQPRPR